MNSIIVCVCKGKSKYKKRDIDIRGAVFDYLLVQTITRKGDIYVIYFEEKNSDKKGEKNEKMKYKMKFFNNSKRMLQA